MASTVRWGVLGAAAIATGRTMPAIQALFASARDGAWVDVQA